MKQETGDGWVVLMTFTSRVGGLNPTSVHVESPHSPHVTEISSHSLKTHGVFLNTRNAKMLFVVLARPDLLSCQKQPGEQ